MTLEIRISSSALLKPATMAGFDVSKFSGDTGMTTKIIKYRDVKVNTSGQKWFVEFKHLIPTELRVHYHNRKWLRIKVYKDINIVKTLEYANQVKRAVEKWLREDFSPFEADMDMLNGRNKQEKQWTIQQAALFFLQKWNNRGLSKASENKYKRSVNRFIKWLTKKGMQHDPSTSIKSEHLENYLEEVKIAEKWTNSTFNGERGFLSTMFNFLDKKGIIKEKLTAGDKLKVNSKKHRYFDERTYKKLKEVLLEKDPYLLFACQCVYYLAIRSEKELQNLKVGNISPESKQVFLTVGKTGQRHIPLVNEMIKIFKKRKIFKYPPDYYVFSVPHKNKFVPDGTPGAEPFNTGFFSKRFAKIREEAGLTSDHTIMGFRHTRAVHLKTDGVKDHDIQMLMGHTDFITTSKYLRELGLSADTEALNKKTRVI